MCSLHIYLPWLGIDRLTETETENRLTGPFLGTETEYAKNLKQNYEEFWNRNRVMKNLETETDEAQRSETGRFLSLITLLFNYIRLVS